jgi:hypothetical protein
MVRHSTRITILSVVIVRESGRSSTHRVWKLALLYLNRSRNDYWMPRFRGA